MRQAIGFLAVALVAVLLVPPPPATAAERIGGVPPGFVPSSTSWTSPQHGWVLGFAPCRTGQCPWLARTFDGGATWWPSGTPDVRLSPANTRARVHFANGWAGLITDGQRLWATRTGGVLWRPVHLPGAESSAGVGALASNDRSFYAIVATDTATRLFTAPLHGPAWYAVPGVELPHRGSGDVVARGADAFVALTAVHRSHGYWVSTAGGNWREAKPPCDIHADADLGLVTGPVVVAACSYNPRMGFMFKDLLRAAPGQPFMFVSRAPEAGITTGFAAASPSTVAITATGGGIALLHRGIQRGTAWHTPLVLSGAPMHDVDFTSAQHGILVLGGPQWEMAGVYQTHDGAATWNRVTFGSFGSGSPVANHEWREPPQLRLAGTPAA